MADPVIEAIIRPEADKGSTVDLKKPPVATISKGDFETVTAIFGASVPAVVQVLVEKIEVAEQKDLDGPQQQQFEKTCREMVAAPAQGLNSGIVKIARSFMEAAGFHPGDRVRVVGTRRPEKECKEITIVEVREKGKELRLLASENQRLTWGVLAQVYLGKFLFQTRLGACKGNLTDQGRDQRTRASTYTQGLSSKSNIQKRDTSKLCRWKAK